MKIRLSPALLTALALMLLATDVYASGGEGHGFPWVHLAVTTLNFVIFLGILAYFGGPKIQEYYATQRATLLEDRDASKRLREAAELKFEEYSTRLDKLDEERKALIDGYHRQGEQEKNQLVADAKREVEKMRADAELVIQQEMRRAVSALEEQTVDLAIQIAKERLTSKVDDAMQGKIVEAYVADLNQMDSTAA